MKVAAAAALVCLLAGAAEASSTTIAVPNYSFEDPAQGDGNDSRTYYPSYPTITGWTPYTSGHSGGAVPHIGLWDPLGDGPAGLTDLQYVRMYISELDLNAGRYTTLTSGAVAQALSGYTYTLTADFMDGGAWGTGSSELQLMIGAAVGETATVSANTTEFTPTSLSWDCTSSGQDIGIQIVGKGGGNPLKLDFDNVRLDYALTPVPAGNLTIKKFFDTHRDGVFNDDDEYLAGWEFNIAGPSYNQNLTTDASGEIVILDLTPGDYVITEAVKQDHAVTSAGGSMVFVKVKADETHVEPFGNVLLGDANMDGIVDGQDFTMLKDKFGTQSGAVWRDGDFCGEVGGIPDGAVDGQDFTMLKAYFGQGVPPAPGGAGVPEPATMSLLGICGLGLLLRRRRG